MSDETLFDEYDGVDAGDDDGIEPQTHALTSSEDVWGERAQQVVDFIKGRRPSIANVVTIGLFARRKGWEAKTLIGVLEYCEQKKLLAHFKSINGAAWKIPLTKVDPAELAPDETPEPAPSQPKKETTMSKDWISTNEAAELLGIGRSGVLYALKVGNIKGKQEGDGGRAPFVIERASVIAYRDRTKQQAKQTDLLDEPKPKKKPKKKAAPATTTAIVVARPSKPAKRVAPPVGDLGDDLRMLLRCIDRGWVTCDRDELVEKLRELVEG